MSPAPTLMMLADAAEADSKGGDGNRQMQADHD
jgi:hypothetical protein